MNMTVLEFLAAPFVASLILTGIHSYLGVHVVERGVIFVDLSLAQIAALGATIALLLPWSNGVHYDSEEQRRPLFQSLIAAGTLPAGYATDDGAGLLYRGTEMVAAFAEKDGAGAYFVERGPDGTAVETELEVTRLR